MSLVKGLKAVKFVQLIENMQNKEQILKDNCNYVSELISIFPWFRLKAEPEGDCRDVVRYFLFFKGTVNVFLILSRDCQRYFLSLKGLSTVFPIFKGTLNGISYL